MTNRIIETMPPVLAIIVPCYNEEKLINMSADILMELLNKLQKNDISNNSYVLFIDDGSNDSTWDIISELHNNCRSIKGIKFSRNFGHQSALLAGLLESINTADIYITVDADIQDDLDVIPRMISRYKEGYEIIYGVRKSRAADTWLKKNIAETFYKIQQIMGIEIVYNHADFRMVSNNVLLRLLEFKESNVYLRAIFPLIGFRSVNEYYDRKPRIAGTPKYSFIKLLALALDGITSFSVRPLRAITFAGSIISFFSFIMILWILYYKFFMGRFISEWVYILLPLCLLGGLQILALGIIGEYIGKVFIEVKQRPKYIIEERL